MGIKYAENVNKGTVIYKKDIENSIYYPYYINHESGQYVYAHRPFKFIENNDNSKNKVSFDATIEGSVVQKYELMSLDFQPIEESTFSDFNETKKLDFIQLKQYDPNIWKDITIMAPLEELKKFKVEE